MRDAISRRAFAEKLALAAAAPLILDDLTPWPPLHVVERGNEGVRTGPGSQAQDTSALAKALAEGVRLRYPDRFTPDDLATITRSIDSRLRAVERLYQTALTNADEPDFVYAVYRGEDA
jgi:hypothetical protein